MLCVRWTLTASSVWGPRQAHTDPNDIDMNKNVNENHIDNIDNNMQGNIKHMNE